ncbi:putative Heat shock protein 70 family [Rosa chinensis]|uniref:Putative Heat shock protein 70 family n=1 Tax=Rosa chinensis TaxID=74649 RepID=A0A2P6RDZ1_ROSCH|nr:uncharacterized protein LOC112195295 [Rosa chinensis]PRQ44651.1 putative Heat shock protein 70 family [Rosa chinensis]
MNTEIKCECPDILCYALHKFGDIMATDHELLLGALLSQLSSNQKNVSKKSVSCIASLASSLSDDLLAKATVRVVQHLSNKGAKYKMTQTSLSQNKSEKMSLLFADKFEKMEGNARMMFDDIWGRWKSQITFGTSVGMICVIEFNEDFFGCYMVLDKKWLGETICNLHLCMSSLDLNLLQVPVHLSNRAFGFTREWHLGNIIWNIAGNAQKLFVAMHGRIEALVIDQENNFQWVDSYLDMVIGLFKNDFSSSPSRNKEGLILVLGLSSGTIEVSYLEISNGVFEVMAVSCESLGGEDSDHARLNFIVSKFAIIKFTVSLPYLRPTWCMSKLVTSGSVALYHGYNEHKRFKCVNNIKISLLVGIIWIR